MQVWDPHEANNRIESRNTMLLRQNLMQTMSLDTVAVMFICLVPLALSPSTNTYIHPGKDVGIYFANTELVCLTLPISTCMW